MRSCCRGTHPSIRSSSLRTTISRAFLTQPTWVEDIRPFRAIMMPLDLPARREDIDRFIPQRGKGVSWLERARSSYVYDMATAMHGAFRDLKLDHARVGFDDVGFGLRLGAEGMQVEDGYDALMFARAVKTPTELKLLERSTRLNEAAITRTVACWQKGATWRDLNTAYAQAVVDLGGFVRDPGGMVWGHPRGTDASLILATGLEDDEVEPGTHVMFDCHGTIDLYCWDGGKTWVVEGEPQGGAKRFADATARLLRLCSRPCARAPGSASCRHRPARSTARRACPTRPRPSSSSTASVSRTWTSSRRTADGKPNGDWMLEDEHGRAGAPALSRRRARALLARGGGSNHAGRRPSAVLLGIFAADEPVIPPPMEAQDGLSVSKTHRGHRALDRTRALRATQGERLVWERRSCFAAADHPPALAVSPRRAGAPAVAPIRARSGRRRNASAPALARSADSTDGLESQRSSRRACASSRSSAPSSSSRPSFALRTADFRTRMVSS